MLDSYNKYKKETQVIVGISAIPIGRIRMTNEELAGGVPPALIPLCEDSCEDRTGGKQWIQF